MRELTREQLEALKIVESHGGRFLGTVLEGGDQAMIQDAMDMDGNVSTLAEYKWRNVYKNWITKYLIDELEEVVLKNNSAYRLRPIPKNARDTRNCVWQAYEEAVKESDALTVGRIFAEKVASL